MSQVTRDQILADIDATFGPAHRITRVRAFSLPDGSPLGHLTVSICAAGDINIENISIVDEHRLKGYGRAAMQRICSIADHHGVSIHLEAFHYLEREGYGHLSKFYAALGFEREFEPFEFMLVPMSRRPVPNLDAEPQISMDMA